MIVRVQVVIYRISMGNSLNKTKKIFGNKVKYYRNLSNITQEKLAEATNSATQTISGIENGTGSPSFKKMCKIADTLNIPISYLFNDNDEILTPNEDEFIYLKLLNNLSSDEKNLVLDFLKYLNEKKTKKQ